MTDIKPVAYRFNIGGQWFTGSTYEGCKGAIDKAGLTGDIEPLYPESALSKAREEGRREGMREAAEMVDEALERAAVLTLKRTAYAPDAEAIRKLKGKNNG